MSDSAIQNAKARREALAAEINERQSKLEELRKELARVEQFIEDWVRFSEAGATKSGSGWASSWPEKTNTVSALVRPQNPPREEVGKAAEEIIAASTRPVPRADLFHELKNRGLEIHGKDPEMVLSTMMWRMQDRFVRMPSGGYWIRDKLCPAVGYKPGDIPFTEGVKKILKPV